MRVLLTGWFSFVDGEATAGDLLAADAVAAGLDRAGVPYDMAWSPVFRPGALSLADAAPDRYTHLVFACGPVHGRQVAGLHDRYRSCRRIAVGVSVIDDADPACAGFDVVLPRDAPGLPPLPDLAASAIGPRLRAATVPVAAVFLTDGQGEYGGRRQHELVASRLTSWLSVTNCTALHLDTRLDQRDWRLCSTPDALVSVVSRLDVVVTMRLHGLVLALSAGIPALAVDPVTGGGKVTAQATALQWPAVLSAEQSADRDLLTRWWDWCTGRAGREAAAQAAARHGDGEPPALVTALVSALRAAEPATPGPARGRAPVAAAQPG